MRILLAILCCALLLAGCNPEHSVLAPHGVQAASIAGLTWLLFGLVAAVFFIVMAATLLAIAGPESIRRKLSNARTVIVGGIVFPVLTLTALLSYGLWLMRESAPKAEPLRIEIVGEQWWWRVRYQADDGRSIERANEIRVPTGKPVVFSLKAADVIHSFWIPSLAGKLDMIPGRTTTLHVTAERSGIYRGICAEYCGGAHAFMMFDVLAMAPDQFSAWLGEQATLSSSDVAQSRGRLLFEQAGCGGCHAIDGTAAAGTIGPNLTGFGTRRSIGAGRLPMTPDNIMQFIAESQTLKPGNKMPSFPVLSGTDLAAIASYLAGLR